MKKVFTILVLALLTCPLAVQACSCAPATAEKEYDDTEVIFAGKVTKITYVDSTERGCDEPRTIVHFQVSAYWKGDVHAKMILHTVENRCSCDGNDFIEGETYLIYAYTEKAVGWLMTDSIRVPLADDEQVNPDDMILATSWCSRTDLLLWSLEDVAIFGIPKEPKL